MDNYRMDRTIVSKSSFAEADDHITFYKDKTPLERLESVCKLINETYNISYETRMNKSVVSSSKLKE